MESSLLSLITNIKDVHTKNEQESPGPLVRATRILRDFPHFDLEASRQLTPQVIHVLQTRSKLPNHENQIMESFSTLEGKNNYVYFIDMTFISLSFLINFSKP